MSAGAAYASRRKRMSRHRDGGEVPPGEAYARVKGENRAGAEAAFDWRAKA